MKHLAHVLVVLAIGGFQPGSVRAQSGAPAEETTASLLRRFQAADAIATKERLLYRMAEQGGEAGKDLLNIAETTNDRNTRWLAIRGLGIMEIQGSVAVPA